MLKLFKNPKLIIALELIIIIPFISINLFQNKIEKVLGQNIQASTPPAVTTANPSMSPSPSYKPSLSVTPSPKLSKSSYTIAIYGDSLVDTMGTNLDYLRKALNAIYPQTKFNLYNYGIGSQNIEQGLARFENEFNYMDRKYPSIRSINPDIVVLGSFAYNPFPTHDKNKHYSLLLELIGKAKSVTPNTYVLEEIAPLTPGFGKGTHGVNWPEDVASVHAGHIVEQLLNAEAAAKSTNTVLIDAYSQTRVNGKFGSPAYTDGNDGIHPSVQGHVITANLIARTIKLK